MIQGNKTNEQQATSPKKVKVKTTNTEVLPQNLQRNGAQFVNEGSNSIWLECGTTALENNGMFLVASGGSWNGMIGPMVWTGPVFGIAPGGETPLAVLEV